MEEDGGAHENGSRVRVQKFEYIIRVAPTSKPQPSPLGSSMRFKGWSSEAASAYVLLLKLGDTATRFKYVGS